ncbi:hypothetical protein [Cupriavidus oxalaticus]|uniref:hypothetical protein n=1 Tax=Cupriavidus oxalaticus TaxID=96344 RepID=UPI00317B90D2
MTQSARRATQRNIFAQTHRLAAYVQELKYLGWPVLSAPVFPGCKRPIAEYWLAPWAIVAARTMGGEA